MRRSAIVMTCVVLAAALLSPGVATAKGGNGSHPVANPEVSDKGKAKTGKSKPQKSDVGKQPKKKAKPQAASPNKPKATSAQRGTAAKDVEKPTRDAPRTEPAKDPQSTPQEPPASAEPPTKATPSSPPSATLAEGPVSAATIGTEGVGTRGVLDTIGLKVSASMDGMRAAAAGMWSAVTSWFGG